MKAAVIRSLSPVASNWRSAFSLSESLAGYGVPGLSGLATYCPVMDEIAELCQLAAYAVGGGLLALHLYETENGLIIKEINDTMEFSNSIATTAPHRSRREVNLKQLSFRRVVAFIGL